MPALALAADEGGVAVLGALGARVGVEDGVAAEARVARALEHAAVVRLGRRPAVARLLGLQPRLKLGAVVDGRKPLRL